jgi:hypothetical protein
MGTLATTAANENAAPTPKQIIANLLEQNQNAIADSLPEGMDAKRFRRLLLTATTTNPKLLTRPVHVPARVLSAAGLEPNDPRELGGSCRSTTAGTATAWSLTSASDGGACAACVQRGRRPSCPSQCSRRQVPRPAAPPKTSTSRTRRPTGSGKPISSSPCTRSDARVHQVGRAVPRAG